jgi:hypothetical protein
MTEPQTSAHRSHRIADASDEPDIDHAVWVVDPHNNPIFVAGDVEDNAAIFEDAPPRGTSGNREGARRRIWLSQSV